MSAGPSDADQHATETPSSVVIGDSLAAEEKKLHCSSHQPPEKHLQSAPETAPSEPPGKFAEHDALERTPTARDEGAQTLRAERTTTTGQLHTVFTKNQKRFIVFMASWAGFFSPVSGQIYFPALNALSEDLHVSNSLINLTLTSYMVCTLPPGSNRVYC